MSSPNPYFGRAWNLTIVVNGVPWTVASTDSGESLRIRFNVYMRMLLAYWDAHFEVYNMGNQSGGPASQITASSPNIYNFWKYSQNLTAGTSVTLNAGYQSQANSLPEVYSGSLLQSWVTIENVTDWKLIISCVTGLLQDALNFTSQAVGAGENQYNNIAAICKQTGIPFDPKNIDTTSQKILENSILSRAQALHGRPYDLIRQITKQNNLWAHVNNRGLQIRSFDAATVNAATPDHTYGPAYIPASYQGSTASQGITPTLLGSPQQTQLGATFRVALDPLVQIADIVQLAPWTIVNLYPIQIGQLPPVPNQPMRYVVAGVRHCGDTRGNDWYTEIEGVTADFFASWLQGNTLQSALQEAANT